MKRKAAPAPLDPAKVNDAGHAPEIGPGGDGEAVLRAQILLYRAGFAPGSLNGAYTEAFAGAVAAFQAEQGLEQTGVVDAATWEALNADQAPALVPLKLTRRGIVNLSARFRAIPGLLQRLNRGKSLRCAGTRILVPDLIPAPPPDPPVTLAGLTVPVQGVDKSSVVDSFDAPRIRHVHRATDIAAPRGTPVVAAVSGPIRTIGRSRRGGRSIYQFDEDESFCYFYAHLDHYAPGLRAGMHVNAGQVIGYVGNTGNARRKAPHLHFAIYRLTPDKRWSHARAVNPYPALTEPRVAKGGD